MKLNKFNLLLLLIFIVTAVIQAGAAGPKVSENKNKHNLSALAWSGGTRAAKTDHNTYEATNDPNGNPGGQQICIFCHTPHNANVLDGAPLWNREFSTQTFQRYSSNTLRIRIDASARTASGYIDDGPTWQPDGSSKLCLSCHDGVSSLGNVLRGGPIAMTGGKDVISSNILESYASFRPDTNKMKTGHHPISFKYDATVIGAISSAGKVGYTAPTIPSVKLDKNWKMQCTTCHDAHQNQTDDTAVYSGTRKIAPFWVYGAANNAVTDHDSVCTTCHPITAPQNVAPWP